MSQKQNWIAAMCAALLLFTLTACKKDTETLPEAETPDIAQTGLRTPEPQTTTSPEPEKDDEESPIVISMVGDCTLASSQYNNDFETVVGDDYTWPFAKVLDILQEDDFTIANLEGSFSDTPLSANTTFYFCAPAAYANILTEGSVECATMGNNHTNEFGKTGVEHTTQALDTAGVAWIKGDTGDLYEVNGMKLGVYVSPYSPSTSDVTSGVKALKDQGADFIIVCAHWGIEGSYRVTSAQSSVAHAAIDAGADVVCGTHPHVLQKTEEYGDGYIFYSLGNFSFGGNTAPRDRDTVIAQITIVKQEDGRYTLDDVNCIPCCLSSKSNGNNYQPIPYKEGTEEYERTISKLDGTFSGPDLVVDYSNLTGGQEDDPAESPEPSDPSVTDDSSESVDPIAQPTDPSTETPVSGTETAAPPVEIGGEENGTTTVENPTAPPAEVPVAEPPAETE